MKSIFKQPKIYDDLVLLYKTYWNTHKHLPRPFRMTTGEDILKEITQCIKKVILANLVDKNHPEQRVIASTYLADTRAGLVVIRGMLTVGWSLKFIAHGLFIKLTQILDPIEKQVTRWCQWFLK